MYAINAIDAMKVSGYKGCDPGTDIIGTGGEGVFVCTPMGAAFFPPNLRIHGRHRRVSDVLDIYILRFKNHRR